MLIADFLQRDRNNFDLVRLVFSFFVIYDHSYGLTPSPGFTQDLIYLATGYYSADLAVKGFFFLSGLLVANSLINSQRVDIFFVSRFFRLWPALVVSTAVLCFILGPIMADSVVVYLSDYNVYKYLGNTALFRILGRNDIHLAGLFEHNATQFTVNSPIWSVASEMYAYSILACIFCVTKLRKHAVLVVSVVLLIDSILPQKTIFTWVSQQNQYFAMLPLAFSLGCLCAAYKQEISIGLLQVVGIFALCYFFRRTPCGLVLGYAAFFALCLLFASSKFAINMKVSRDISYGVYLYGWPIQQCYNVLFPTSHQFVAIVACMAVASIFGYMSSRLVEVPCIKLGRKVAIYVSERMNKLSVMQLSIMRKPGG